MAWHWIIPSETWASGDPIHWCIYVTCKCLHKFKYRIIFGLLMWYGDKDLGQHWPRIWLVAWQHQVITWTNVSVSSVTSSDNHLSTISYESHSSIIKAWNFFFLKPHLNFPGANSYFFLMLHFQIGKLSIFKLRFFPLILTHWGLVMPYDDIDLGQHWLR